MFVEEERVILAKGVDLTGVPGRLPLCGVKGVHVAADDEVEDVAHAPDVIVGVVDLVIEVDPDVQAALRVDIDVVVSYVPVVVVVAVAVFEPAN